MVSAFDRCMWMEGKAGRKSAAQAERDCRKPGKRSQKAAGKAKKRSAPGSVPGARGPRRGPLRKPPKGKKGVRQMRKTMRAARKAFVGSPPKALAKAAGLPKKWYKE